MTPERAAEFADQIIASTTGWNDASSAALLEEIATWHDEDAAENAVWFLCHNWAERSRPPLGWIVRAYNEAREAERRADAELGPRRPEPVDFIHPREGREVAFQAYIRGLHLPDDEISRQRFNKGGNGVWASFVETESQDEDVNIAVLAVAQGASYTKVLQSFGGDHLRAGRALRTLEKGGRIVHRTDGWITPARAH